MRCAWCGRDDGHIHKVIWRSWRLHFGIATGHLLLAQSISRTHICYLHGTRYVSRVKRWYMSHVTWRFGKVKLCFRRRTAGDRGAWATTRSRLLPPSKAARKQYILSAATKGDGIHRVREWPLSRGPAPGLSPVQAGRPQSANVGSRRGGGRGRFSGDANLCCPCPILPVCQSLARTTFDRARRHGSNRRSFNVKAFANDPSVWQVEMNSA